MVFEPVVGGEGGRVHEALKRHRLFAARFLPPPASLVSSFAPINFIVATSSQIFSPRICRSKEEQRSGEHGSLRLIDSAHRLADKPDQPVMTFTREMAGRKNGRRRRKREREVCPVENRLVQQRYAFLPAAAAAAALYTHVCTNS